MEKDFNADARQRLDSWQAELAKNVYADDQLYQHTLQYYFAEDFPDLHNFLLEYGNIIAKTECTVMINNQRSHLPNLVSHNPLGERINYVDHHPTYLDIGDAIYGGKILENIAQPGRLLAATAVFHLASQLGEAGHNCPLACTAGVIRVFNRVNNVPNKEFYLKKMTTPSFRNNFTGAQFLTEIQGGCDVGQNVVAAKQDEDGQWRIHGEKWFCSNANADLFLLSARVDNSDYGTKGLSLFLIPARLENNESNNFAIRRLKEKLGTCSMATGEIEFQGALAYPMGDLADGFNIAMEEVLHMSRLLNAVCVVGMVRRGYEIAYQYAKERFAFGHEIIDYPLVQEHLARIRAENLALQASIFAVIHRQDMIDTGDLTDPEEKLLQRLLVNGNKYFTAQWSVEHLHHCLDILGGNGVIESFSSLPRLLRDCIVCENWEGTHNILRMQLLRDLAKFDLGRIYLQYMQRAIQQLPEQAPHKSVLQDRVAKVQQNLQELSQADQAIQTLMIKDIFADMMLAYTALQLLKEGLHQQQHQGEAIKLAALELFVRYHFSDANEQYDERYLSLIKQVING